MTKKEAPLRRGEEETRSNHDRARDNFNELDQRNQWGSVRQVPCPAQVGASADQICGANMRLEKQYRPPNGYHVVGVCSKTKAHNIERYGFYANDTETTT